MNSLERIDVAAQKTTLAELLEQFKNIRQGMSKSTRETELGMINKLESSWKHGLDIRVSDIKLSMLEEWLAQRETKL